MYDDTEFIKTDFSKTVGLRLYDAELIEKLNRRYDEGGIRYDTKNAFLTDLIEAGLERKESDDGLQKKLTDTDAAITERLDKLYDKISGLEKTVGIINANIFVNQKMLGTIYAMSQSTNLGQRILEQELDNGLYDPLPSRFTVLKGKLLERYTDDG